MWDIFSVISLTHLNNRASKYSGLVFYIKAFSNAVLSMVLCSVPKAYILHLSAMLYSIRCCPFVHNVLACNECEVSSNIVLSCNMQHRTEYVSPIVIGSTYTAKELMSQKKTCVQCQNSVFQSACKVNYQIVQSTTIVSTYTGKDKELNPQHQRRTYLVCGANLIVYEVTMQIQCCTQYSMRLRNVVLNTV